MMDRAVQKELIELLASLLQIFQQIDWRDREQRQMVLDILQSVDDKCNKDLPSVRYEQYHDMVGSLGQIIEETDWQQLDSDDLFQCRALCQEIVECVQQYLRDEVYIKKEIFFLPYKASMWDSLESVWQAAVDDKAHCNAYVVPIPYYERNSDGEIGERRCEADLFPDYDKVIYLDCDTIVLGDISELYNYDIKDYFIAGALEEVMQTVDTFGNYVEQFLGVPRKQYINAGVLLINNKRFLKFKIAEKFVELAKQYTFRVTQDEDYLNVLCKNRIKILNLGWNKTAYKNDAFDDKDLKLIHYKINWKPWHYKNTLYEEYFWDFAKQTDFYDEILAMRDAYGDDLKQRDANAYVNLVKMAEEDIANPKGYWKTVAQFEQQKAKGLVRINYLKLLRKLIGIRSRTTSE